MCETCYSTVLFSSRSGAHVNFDQLLEEALQTL